MTFKNYQLIINNDIPKSSDIEKVFEIGMQFIKGYSENMYEIDKQFIENRFLWLCCNYDNAKYNENVINHNDNYVKEVNPRSKNQLELRNQLFICYDTEKNLLYTNQNEKKGFIKHYFSSTLSKEVIIKSIVCSIDDLENKVKEITRFKFIQNDTIMTRVPGSTFEQTYNIFGLDVPDKMTIQVDYKSSTSQPIKQIIKKFKEWKKSDNFENIVLIGRDDDNLEQCFDFNSLISHIEIKPIKNINGMYNSVDVIKEFTDKIR